MRTIGKWSSLAVMFLFLFVFFTPRAHAADAYVVCHSHLGWKCFDHYQKAGGTLSWGDEKDGEGKVTTRGFATIVKEANGIKEWNRHNLRSMFVPAPKEHVELPLDASRHPSKVIWTEVPDSGGALTASYETDKDAVRVWNAHFQKLGWNGWRTYRVLGGALPYDEFLAASKDVNGITDWDRHDKTSFLFPAVPVYYRFADGEAKPDSVAWHKGPIDGLYQAEHKVGSPVVAENPPVLAVSAPASVPPADTEKDHGLLVLALLAFVAILVVGWRASGPKSSPPSPPLKEKVVATDPVRETVIT